MHGLISLVLRGLPPDWRRQLAALLRRRRKDREPFRVPATKIEVRELLPQYRLERRRTILARYHRLRRYQQAAAGHVPPFVTLPVS